MALAKHTTELHSSPALDVRLMTALQVLQVWGACGGADWRRARLPVQVHARWPVWPVRRAGVRGAVCAVCGGLGGVAAGGGARETEYHKILCTFSPRCERPTRGLSLHCFLVATTPSARAFSPTNRAPRRS